MDSSKILSEETKERLDNLHPLVSYIRDCFERAKTAKQPVEDSMIEALRAYNMEYSPDKIAAIREIGGSEIFLPLINIKVRALKAWLTDIFFRPGEPPFDIEPTPVPTLPTQEEEQLRQEMLQEYTTVIDKALQLHQISGGQFDISPILEGLSKQAERIGNDFLNKVNEKSKRLAELEKRRIDDQFTEGGFYKALDEVLLDIALFPASIMKGSVPRKVKVFGKDRMVEEKVIPTFNRVSPFDIYPSPTTSDFSDWVIEVLHLTPFDLYSLKGVDGYNEEVIDLILSLYEDTGYRVVTYNSERDLLEGKDRSRGNIIDVLEFWGEVKGELLSDVITEDIEIDPDEYYSVAVWVCDEYILKAIINPDPLGEKPYCKCSFVTFPDSFWGLSLADVLMDLQESVNAVSRAIVNNSVLSSGPMIERNIDRVPPHEEKAVVPWKIFDSTDLGFQAAPAYRFYQPNLTAAALIQVLAYYLKLADELSGVPAYAHSDVTTGAAGRTASGLRMLMESSSRGIKQVVKAIDEGIIKPIVKRQYYYNLIDYYGLDDEVPDLNIKAKGTIHLMEKEAQVQRLIELLTLTNNPVDLQLVGLKGRKYILDRIFRNFGIEIPAVDELNEMVESLQQQLAQMQHGGQQAGPTGQVWPSRKDQSPVAEQAGQFRGESLKGG